MELVSSRACRLPGEPTVPQCDSTEPQHLVQSLARPSGSPRASADRERARALLRPGTSRQTETEAADGAWSTPLDEANAADDLSLLRRLVEQADQLPPNAVSPAAVARACKVLVRVSDDEEQWRPVPHLARGTDRPGWHDRIPTRGAETGAVPAGRPPPAGVGIPTSPPAPPHRPPRSSRSEPARTAGQGEPRAAWRHLRVISTLITGSPARRHPSRSRAAGYNPVPLCGEQRQAFTAANPLMQNDLR